MKAYANGVRRRFDAPADTNTPAPLSDGIDPAAIAVARDFGSRLAPPVLDMMKGLASADAALALRWAFTVATIGAALLLTWRAAMQGAPIGFAGALAPSLAAGLLASILVEAGARGRIKQARRAFKEVEDAFVAHLREATSAAHQRLVALRKDMQGDGDLRQAVLAAQEARDLTGGLSRLVDAAPLLAVSGDAQTCPHLIHDIRAIAANANRLGFDRVVIVLGALLGAGFGAALLAFSLQGPLTLAPPPPIVETLTAFVMSKPRTFGGLAVVLLLVGSVAALPSMLVEARAERNPRRSLDRLVIASALNDLRAAAGAALAERPSEAAERYAEAFEVLGARLSR